MRWTFVVFATACSAAAPREAPAPPAPAPVPTDAERHYAIWLGGAQVGTAHERERWSRAGVRLRRTEAMRFLRGQVPVQLATTIEITADPRLVPSRVTWTEIAEHAQTVRRGEASRDATGWVITDDTGVRTLPPGAIPAELVPMVVRRDGRFAGEVFLPARGFVSGSARIDPVAPDRLIARLALTTAIAEATIDLGADAMPVRVVDGEGVIATRITAAQSAAAFPSVDLIAATSIPLSGAPGDRLVLEGDLAIPPVPGQAVRSEARRPPRPRNTGNSGGPGSSDSAGDAGGARSPDRIEVQLSAQLPGSLPAGPRGPDRTRAITALVASVHARITPDLGAHPASARTAAVAVTGDCTTFALAYAALATAQAIPTLVVTGFRVDGDRLIRHRWAVSWTGRAWIAIDAAFGAAPAGGDLVGLAIHDADDAGLVAGEAALTHLRAATWK